MRYGALRSAAHIDVQYAVRVYLKLGFTMATKERRSS